MRIRLVDQFTAESRRQLTSRRPVLWTERVGNINDPVCKKRQVEPSRLQKL